MDWIFWMKLSHTFIFFFASACIVYVVYCGVVGKTNNYLGAAVGIVFMIGLGPSSGGALWAALQLCREVENATIVTVVCDRGDRYISTGVFPA